MIKVARHLITTADERTWRFDRPVLFLGEWCRRYDRSAVWLSMDAEVAAPFRLKIEKKLNDLDFIQALTDTLLIELTVALNVFHNTNHTTRYWNILLGHWLKLCVSVCFKKYFTIEQALKSYNISGTTVIDTTDYILIMPDLLSFKWACNDDVWNSILNARVLQYMGCKNIELDSVSIEDKKSLLQKQYFSTTYYLCFKQYIKAIISYLLSKFSKHNDSFIINSYLPKWQEIKLQLALGQCPQLWKSPPLNTASIDLKMRRKFTISSEFHAGFEKFVRDLFPKIIPTCYLEGYEELNKQVKSLPWPSKPKFIYTSNNFETDEIFKAWVGLKTEQGVPYFTGQHGNNYGTLYGSQYRPEDVTADKFFTWGWNNGNEKNIPAFVFTIANKIIKPKPDGGLLLIELFNNEICNSIDFAIYQKQQFCFVEALPDKIQKELTVRLHSEWRNSQWSDDRRWIDRMPAVNLETGEARIQNLIAKSRLVVHSYDSTGILEGLASNFPTMCFWNGGLDHLLPSAKPYYELLRRAGIIADSPEHAAQLVARHWDSIDVWWKSEKVQSARESFCERYARVDKHPVRTMRRLLTTAASSINNQQRSNNLGKKNDTGIPPIH